MRSWIANVCLNAAGRRRRVPTEATSWTRRILVCRGIAGPMAVAIALYPFSALSQPSGLIPPDPKRQGLPQIQQKEEELVPRNNRNAPSGEALPDQVLPSPIARVEVHSPVLTGEIEALLRPFIGKTVIPGDELAQTRGEIWSLLRQHGRMTRVDLHGVPGGAGKESVLQVSVHQITVRSVLVEQERGTELDQATLNAILVGAKGDIAEGGILDLDRLDSRIRRRIYLRDVDVRATLVPAGPDLVDVKILVAAKPRAQISGIVQFDNYGMKTYGPERFTFGVSIPGRIFAGDQLDVLTINSSRMNYGRVAYEVPLLPLGARLDTSGAIVTYRAPSGEKGITWLLDAGLSYPVHFGDETVVTGRLGYQHRQQTDRLTNFGRIADKKTDSIQGKLDARYYPGAAQTFYFSSTLTGGNLDLSGLPSALALDGISARTDGTFAKAEWQAGYNALFGQDGQFDVRIDAMGQVASKNLDQSEKLTLGGPFALRAFGPSEGLGDEGFVVNTEAGFHPTQWLRAFTFYGVGQTRRYNQPWASEPIPLSYNLQAAGVGLSASYGPLVGSITYARQIGDNPGLSANGLDSDGVRDRDRIWLSLTFRR